MIISNWEYIASHINADDAVFIADEESKTEVLIESSTGDCLSLISGDNTTAICTLINDEGVYKLVVWANPEDEEPSHIIDVTQCVLGKKGA